jgi:hypothetical protein
VNSSALAYISTLRIDPHPSPDYRVCRTIQSIDAYFDGHAYWPCVATDTESTPDHLPYCVTFSHTPGTGRLIYTHDLNCITHLGNYFSAADLLLFHNYLHDVHPFAYLSLPIPAFRDTMVLAYLACLGGGGSDEEGSMAGRGSLSLKSLAYRHCNMSMTSFRDTVYPHSVPHLLTYLQSTASALDCGPTLPTCTCGHLRSDHVSRGATGKLKGTCSRCSACTRYKLGNAKKDEEDKLLGLLLRKTNSLISSIISHPSYPYDMDEDEEEEQLTEKEQSFDPYKRIKHWHPHDHRFLNLLSGPIPKPSIADVPEPELLQYACRDADATLRLYLFLDSYYPWLFY